MLASLTGLVQLIRCPAGCSAAVLQWMLPAVLVAQPKTGDNCTAAVGDILQPAVCPSRHQATPGWWEERAGHHSADSVAAAAVLHAYEEMRPRAAARAGEVLRG